MSTIPASDIVAVTPNVLSAGGDALDLNGLLLTNGARVPIGTVGSFASAAAVAAYFGSSSTEKALADDYFPGFDNSTKKPGALKIAQYNEDDVGAWLRGATLSGMTLAELQALNAALSVTIDGVLKSATVNLAAATSFSNAAALIQAALAIHGPQAASITGSIAATTLTVSAVASGSIAVGQVLVGTGITAGTVVTALLSGTGSTGTYTVGTSQTALSQAIVTYEPGVSYDSTSGAFQIFSPSVGEDSTITFGSGALATSLKLTSATGAVLSQGADAADPEAFMDGILEVTQNWATFTTGFDPDASGNDNKVLFASWTSDQNKRYAYIGWDTDESPKTTDPATSSFGYLVNAADYEGTFVISAPDASYAMFVMGIGASIDFEQANGRTDYDFRAQAGLVATVTDQTTKDNLIANHYNLYGAWGTANDEFVFLNDGTVSGDFRWMDSYINQIWMNNAFQLALMVLLTRANSIPYNASGRAMIEQGLNDSIQAALNFGAIQGGVALSSTQIAEVNSAAGVRISDILATRGWYLQVLPASAAVRAARGSPPCTFWYCDGGSVHNISLASVELQ